MIFIFLPGYRQGVIVTEIGMLNGLQQLDLSNQEQGLTGHIPYELSQLDHLSHLRLSGNKLTGTIPVGLGFLLRLEELDLSSNDLTGGIPDEIGRLKATATSNTDIIMNSVIILFITDLDELMYDILFCINSDWCEELVKNYIQHYEEGPNRDSDEGDEEKCAESVQVTEDNYTQEDKSVTARLKTVETQVQSILKHMDMLIEENKELKRLLLAPEEANRLKAHKSVSFHE